MMPNSSYPRFRLHCVLAIVVAGLLLCTACLGTDPVESSTWRYADLRALDPPVGSPDDPELDLTAVYAKNNGKDIDFRLEMLEVQIEQRGDIYLLLDILPSQAQDAGALAALDWRLPPGMDIAVKVAADGRHRAWYLASGDPLPQPRLRIQRNPLLDLIDLHLRLPEPVFPSSRTRVQVLVTAPEMSTPADLSAVFNLTGSPPGRAEILFAFWDVFPVHTPAQALRGWDGAHSGPFGERHGLNPLLTVFRDSQVPLLLFDLLEPASLSGLDYLQVLPKVERLAHHSPLAFSNSLTPLPDFIANRQRSAMTVLADNRMAAQSAGLSACQCTYLADPALLTDLPHQPGLLFTHQPGEVHSPYLQTTRWRGQKLFLLPDEPSTVLDRSGLTVAGRLAVLQTALGSPEAHPRRDILVLGGSLPLSAWGDPNAARAALEYLGVRPWVRFLTPPALAGIPIDQANSLPVDRQAQVSLPGSASLELSDSYPSDAWSAARTLLQPPLPPISDWSTLQAAYRWIPELLHWVQQQAGRGTPRSTCVLRLPGLDQPLCVLANDDMLAVIEPLQTGLLYFGRLEKDHFGYAQMIGPSAQLVLGLSDPSTWQLTAGPFADPAVIPAAFTPSQPFEVMEFTDQQLHLVYQSYSITYRLLPDSLEVRLSCLHTGCDLPAAKVPLVITPQARFNPAWSEAYAYQFDAQQKNLGIGYRDGPSLQVTSNSRLQLISFRDSLAPDVRRENPDQEVPAGHFLPLGLSLLQIPPPEVDSAWFRFSVP